MLKEYWQNENLKKLDLNCAESVLYAANEVYRMKLAPEAIRLSSAFGGGMGIEDKCGTVAAALMVLGYLFVEKNARESGLVKEISGEFLKEFEEQMKSLDCRELKTMHRTETEGCDPVITSALEVLDLIIGRNADRRVR